MTRKVATDKKTHKSEKIMQDKWTKNPKSTHSFLKKYVYAEKKLPSCTSDKQLPVLVNVRRNLKTKYISFNHKNMAITYFTVYDI